MKTSYLEDLEQGKRYLSACDRLFYVGLSILKDRRILITVLNELEKSLYFVIKAYLKYEIQKKTIKSEKNPEKNLQIFIKQVAPKYVEKHEIAKVIQLVSIFESHKSSPMEFIRHGKLVIMKNARYEIVSEKDLLDYSKVIKKFINKFPLEKA